MFAIHGHLLLHKFFLAPRSEGYFHFLNTSLGTHSVCPEMDFPTFTPSVLQNFKYKV